MLALTAGALLLPPAVGAQLRSFTTIAHSPAFAGGCAPLSPSEPPPTQRRDFNADEIYPIGFSPRGLFAYVRRRSDSMQEMETLTIMNLVSDERVAYLGMYGEELEPTSEPDVASVLRGHGISPSTDIRLAPFPLEIDGERYTATVADAGGASGPGRSYAVYLESSRRGRKQIGSVLVRDLSDHPRERVVRGYFRSPHEPRVVVAVSGPSYGGETGFDCNVHLFGAHLTVRFPR
jgi:hypothetical protein